MLALPACKRQPEDWITAYVWFHRGWDLCANMYVCVFCFQVASAPDSFEAAGGGDGGGFHELPKSKKGR